MIHIIANDDGSYDLINLSRHEMLALRDAIRRSSRPLTRELLPDLAEHIDAVIPEPADA